MMFLARNGTTLHFHHRTGVGRAVVFLNSLGTDMRIWDAVIAGLPADMPVVCIDKRGHGLSDSGEATMDHLVDDVAAVLDHCGITDALLCGVSVGGMVAQGLATARPDLVAGLVLCCTGAQIGTAEMWNTRIAAVEKDGLAAMAPAILERWFSAGFRSEQPTVLAGYHNMLSRTPAAGYAAVCAAIRDTDFTASTANITLPTYCIAGTEDLSTPPDVVRHLSALIDKSSLEIIPDCGHLPCIEAPNVVAEAINTVHKRIR